MSRCSGDHVSRGSQAGSCVSAPGLWPGQGQVQLHLPDISGTLLQEGKIQTGSMWGGGGGGGQNNAKVDSRLWRTVTS